MHNNCQDRIMKKGINFYAISMQKGKDHNLWWLGWGGSQQERGWISRRWQIQQGQVYDVGGQVFGQKEKQQQRSQGGKARACWETLIHKV